MPSKKQALASSQRTAALVNGLTVAERRLDLDHVVRCRTVIAGFRADPVRWRNQTVSVGVCCLSSYMSDEPP